MGRANDTRPTVGLALIRFVTGMVLLSHGWRWVSEHKLEGSVVRESVNASLGELGSVLRTWGETFLLFNPDAMAFLWRWGALLLGLLITLGALTRPAGALACFFLAHGLVYGPPEYELPLVLLLVSCLASAASGAGRRLGLDAVFDQHFPSWLTWKKRSSSIFP